MTFSITGTIVGELADIAAAIKAIQHEVTVITIEPHEGRITLHGDRRSIRYAAKRFGPAVTHWSVPYLEVVA